MRRCPQIAAHPVAVAVRRPHRRRRACARSGGALRHRRAAPAHRLGARRQHAAAASHRGPVGARSQRGLPRAQPRHRARLHLSAAQPPGAPGRASCARRLVSPAARPRAACARRRASLLGVHDFSAFRAAECQARLTGEGAAPRRTSSASASWSCSSSPPMRSCTTWCATSSAAWSRSATAAARPMARARCWRAATATGPRRPSPPDGLVPHGSRIRRGLGPAGVAASGCLRDVFLERCGLAAHRSCPERFLDGHGGQDLRHHAGRGRACGRPRRRACHRAGVPSGEPALRQPSSARAQIVERLPPFVTAVACSSTRDPQSSACRVLREVPLQLLQFHGDEPPELCARFGLPYIKAVRVAPGTDLLQYAGRLSRRPKACCSMPSSTALHGGTGRSFDWSLIPARSAAAGGARGRAHPAQCGRGHPGGPALGGRREQRRGTGKRHQGRRAR